MKFVQKLEKLFGYCFMIFPLLLAAILSLTVFIAIQNLDTREHFFWPEAHHVIIIGVFVVAFWCFFTYASSKRHLGKLIVVIGVALRFIGFYIFRNCFAPWSDFSRVWNIANSVASEGELKVSSLYLVWSNWSAMQRLLVRYFGVRYQDIVLMDMCMSIIVILEVYFIAKMLTSDDKMATLACGLYAFMPSQVIYSWIPTTDQFALPFFCGALLLILFLFKHNNVAVHKKALCCLGIGILLGIGSCFKPIGSIIAIAFAITVILILIKSKANVRRVIFGMGGGIVTVFLIMSGFHMVSKGLSERILDIKINDSITAHYLMIGLNTEGEGQIHIGTKSRYYDNLMYSGVDEDTAAKESMTYLVQDWKDNTRQIPVMFAKKLRWAWQDDMTPVHYFINNDMIHIDEGGPIQHLLFDIIKIIAPAASQWYYVIVMLTACLGVFVMCRKDKMNDSNFIVMLYAFGFALLLALSESQSRYKSSILPVVLILSMMGCMSCKAAIAHAVQTSSRKRLIKHEE